MNGDYLGATMLALTGGCLFYLTVRHQKLLKHALPRAARVPAALLLLGAWGVFTRQLGPLTSFYTALTLVMLWWSVAPLLIAWIARRRRTA